MALPIFYYPNDLNKTTSLLLEGDMAKHIVQVLRMQAGEKLRLTDGKGASATATLLATAKKTCEVTLSDREEHPKTTPELHLGIAFTKNASRNEWLLEKATELGVSVIQPLITTRTERIHAKEERWQNILVSAMLQSQQYYLPILEKPRTLKDMTAANADIPQKLIAHCDNQVQRRNLYEVLQPGQTTTIWIGPEGDFTNEEIAMATQNGFKGIYLGANRLRTETAAMAVCAYFKMMNP